MNELASSLSRSLLCGGTGLLSQSSQSSGHCVCVSRFLALLHWVIVPVKIAMQPSDWLHHSRCPKPRQGSHLHRSQKTHAHTVSEQEAECLSSGV